MARTFSCLWLLLSIIACAGCGGATMHPVSGTVSYSDGEPLTGGQVVFSNPKEHISAIGNIQPDGAYTLGTYAADDGAPAGTYQVAVSPPGDENPPTIHPRFLDPDASGLEYTVEPGENTFDIVVERPGR